MKPRLGPVANPDQPGNAATTLAIRAIPEQSAPRSYLLAEKLENGWTVPSNPHAIPIMISEGSARERLFRYWETQHCIDTEPTVIIGVSRPMLSWKGPLATTTATGFDNRMPIVPFSLCGNGEDTLFWLALRKCAPDAYIGCIPLYLLHAPKGKRLDLPLPSRLRLTDILNSIILGCGNSSPFGSSERHVRAIGRHLIDCGTATTNDFTQYVLWSVRKRLLGSIENCERLLEIYRDYPQWWARKMKSRLMQLQHTAFSPTAGLPVDLVPAKSDHESYADLQKIVLLLGRTFHLWPDIICIAEQLNLVGGPLGTRLQ